MKKLITLMAMAIFLITGVLSAQTVTGTIVDPDTDEKVIGASVLLKGTTVGVITGVDGKFKIDVSSSDNPVLRVSYLGYDTKDIIINESGNVDLGDVELMGQSLGLEEVVVLGLVDIADDRRTPVAVSTITAQEIQMKSGNTEFPDVLKSTPSVYVQNQIGGFGDGQIFTRGFDQTNTAFLLNGQPINGMEDGQMYWSNWSGMNDVANAVQIQRGLGSSKLAISSVGGTVNIITKATEKQKGGFAQFTYGNDNYLKGTVAYNTGLMENGIGVSALVTHWQGDGWADGTNGQGQNYFFSIGYKPSEKHNLNFLITGAPQWHDQNFTKRISDHEDEDGNIDRRFNTNWSGDEDNYFTERRNFYHKPVANLNWAWNLSEKSSLSTVAYASWGRGGGTGSVGSRSAKIRNADGTIDFDQIKANNIADGGASEYAIRASMNNHQWYGLVTNYETKLTDNLSLSVGGDLRDYTGIHFRQIIDLMGADHFLDTRHARYPDNQITATYEADPWATVSSFAEENERYDRDYSERITYGGLFGQLEYVQNRFSAFVQGSVSSQKHIRWDRYKETEENEESESVTNPGFNVKGGANFNVNQNHSVFVNAGFYSRQPYHDNIYLNRSNFINESATNEKITGLEAGYRFRSNAFDLNLNIYRTEWADRVDPRVIFEGDTVTVDGQEFIFDDDGVNNLSNLTQLHQGVEVDFKYRPMADLAIRGFASFGDWQYKGKTKTELFDGQGNLLASEDALDIDGVKVGNAAQTTFGIGASYNITSNIDVYADYNYYDNLYGSTSPFSANEAIELPSYGLLDLGAGYKWLMNNGNVLRIRANVYNVLNEEYISYSRNNIAASDNADENYEGVNKSNSVAWGMGTTFNASIRYSF